MYKSIIQIEEEHKDILQPNEGVIWYQEEGDPLDVPKGLFISCLVLISIVIGFILHISDVGFYASISVAILFNVITIGIYLIVNSDIYSLLNNNTIYLVTNDRFIFIDNKNKENIRSYPHRDIYRLYTIGTDLKLQNKTDYNPYDELSYPVINNAIKYESNYQTIIDAWYKKSIYIEYINSFKEISNKYGFFLDEQKALYEYAIEIKGNLEGMPLSLEIDNIRNTKKLSINIKCPNKEKNHLLIHKEIQGDIFRKSLGMEDIEIRDSVFDKRYIIQSKSRDFLTSILDSEVKDHIQKAYQYLNGRIEIREYNPRRKETRKKIVDDNILDANLFHERKERKENHISTLKYSIDINNYNTHKLIPQTIHVLEMMMALALNIQEYDKTIK